MDWPLLAACVSVSSVWTLRHNLASVIRGMWASPRPDTQDGSCTVTVTGSRNSSVFLYEGVAGKERQTWKRSKLQGVCCASWCDKRGEGEGGAAQKLWMNRPVKRWQMEMTRPNWGLRRCYMFVSLSVTLMTQLTILSSNLQAGSLWSSEGRWSDNLAQQWQVSSCYKCRLSTPKSHWIFNFCNS